MSDLTWLIVASCVPITLFILQKRKIDSVMEQLRGDHASLHTCQSDSLERVVQAVRVVQGSISRLAVLMERVTTARQPVDDV